MVLRLVALVGVAVGILSVPALAHHSFAMFDRETSIEVPATVVELQWTNPHSWLEVTILDEQGQPLPVALEMSSPTSLIRDGWNPRIVMPGDQITVTYRPMRDGSNRQGQFVSMVLANGDTYE